MISVHWRDERSSPFNVGAPQSFYLPGGVEGHLVTTHMMDSTNVLETTDYSGPAVTGARGLTLYIGRPLAIAANLLVSGSGVLIVWRLRRTVRLANTCPTCGYDLRATPDRCPECGRVSSVA